MYVEFIDVSYVYVCLASWYINKYLNTGLVNYFTTMQR